MLTDYEVSTAIRNGLAEELRDLQAEPELVQKVRYHVLRHKRRRAVRTGALVVLALVVAVLPVALRGSPSRGQLKATDGTVDAGHSARASTTLVGIRFSLPPGYALDSAAEENCSAYWTPAGPMPPPGFPPIEDQSFASLAFTSPNGAGCMRVANSATYLAEPLEGNPPNDPVAPKGAVSVMVGPYRAAVSAEPDQGTTVIYVQIPTPGGGFHDLLVASQGMATSELESILEKALPQSYAPVPIAASSTTTTEP